MYIYAWLLSTGELYFQPLHAFNYDLCMSSISVYAPVSLWFNPLPLQICLYPYIFGCGDLSARYIYLTEVHVLPLQLCIYSCISSSNVCHCLIMGLPLPYFIPGAHTYVYMMLVYTATLFCFQNSYMCIHFQYQRTQKWNFRAEFYLRYLFQHY